MAKIRVLVVDDHTIVRDGIRSLLARRRDIEVVGEAANGKQAINQAAALHPDVVLMDIAMPGTDGLQATQQIHHCFPNMRILVLTQYENKEYVFPLLRAGACGYLVKLTRASDLINAIRIVHTEGAYLPPSIARQVVGGVSQCDEEMRQPLVSEREREIVQLIASGASRRQIAEKLHISVRTVDTHRANIMERFGVHNSAELVVCAIRGGIVNVQ